MTYLAAERLWFLALVAVIAAVYVAVQVRKRTYAVRFTNIALLDSVAPRRPGWRRHLAAAAFILAIVSSVVAFARPTRDEKVPKERATVILAIDTSLSMQAEDVAPNRLEAAQEAATSFLDHIPDTINIGLVSFDGVARIEVPPTTDREAVRSVIAGLELNEGTAIGEAIFASLDAIERAPEPASADEPAPGRIVLMSDGETTVGRPNEDGVAAADEAKVPISTIAFGTQDGVVDIPGEPVPVPVPVNEGALRDIADQTGGTFFRAVTERELAEVYKDIGSSIGFTIEKHEIGTTFVGIALGLMLATAAMSLAWFSRLP